MPSLADSQELIGFYSYSREDDHDSDGELSKLRESIQRSLRTLLGRTGSDFRLWQDKAALGAGARWEAEITRAISQAMFFIPIVTPTTIRSQYCRFEFNAFLEREKKLGRENLIFPILYVNVPALEMQSRVDADNVLGVIQGRQFVNWTQFRHEGVDKRAVERFCQDIVDVLNQDYEAPAPDPAPVSSVRPAPSASRGQPPHLAPRPDTYADAPSPRRPASSRRLAPALGLLGGAVALAAAAGIYFTQAVPKPARIAVADTHHDALVVSPPPAPPIPPAPPVPPPISTATAPVVITPAHIAASVADNSQPAPPDMSARPAAPMTVLTAISRQVWAIAGSWNCSVPAKRYELTVGSGQIHWKTGWDETDDETIWQDTAAEAHTTTIASHHGRSGKPETIGTAWTYSFDGAGNLMIKRNGTLLVKVVPCP